MIGQIEWMQGYGDLIAMADEDGVIPLIGVRVLLGLTSDGRKQLLYELDCESANVNKFELIGALEIIVSQLKLDALQAMGLM